jgi:hypothetical protein
MPTDLLERAGNPKEFRISFEDDRFLTRMMTMT